jgi:hypothetical protein
MKRKTVRELAGVASLLATAAMSWSCGPWPSPVGGEDAGASASGGSAPSGGSGGTNPGECGGSTTPDAGAGDAAAGSAGFAGRDAADATLVLSTSTLTFGAVECGGGSNPPQSFTITNSGNSTLDWSGTVTPTPTFFSLAPAEGALAPGAQVTVTVTPSAVPANSVPWNDVPDLKRVISIVGDPAGAQTIAVEEKLIGDSFDWSPASLDFGSVPIGSSKTLSITARYGSSTLARSLDSKVWFFWPSMCDASHPESWSVTFSPRATGLQSTTLTLSSLGGGPSCTPQSIHAQGSGFIVDAEGCSITGAPAGTPCGSGVFCSAPGPARSVTCN